MKKKHATNTANLTIKNKDLLVVEPDNVLATILLIFSLGRFSTSLHKNFFKLYLLFITKKIIVATTHNNMSNAA